ncbi:helix-turn-helix transcriptional regulator [Mycolicibacterium mageritense]|uniref:helix-turn-helix transcriptional regulator n=1 Tax=Mycolicibacterium mageritense TaxID=53462 RepID=UPI001E3A9442|nr:LuxR family transcriptional regulator [Mycolicibacterium mageritense]GJJ22028.1 LuxR family transcriptional regulator [Mycolicibacterium mageritense]
MPQGPCVGRDRELADLARELAATEQGARMVAVVGEPGVGKTALLRQLAAQYGGWWAHAVPWETDLPGGVLAQLVQDDVPADPLLAAAHLVDHLRAAGVRLLVIDDAQHADVESVQALSTLVRHQRDLPVLIVLSAPATETLPVELTGSVLSLGGLSARAVTELARLRGVIVHPTVAARLATHTGGNARDVVALLDEVPTPVWARPDAALPAPRHTVADVDARFAACGAEGRALVEALAVLGDDATLAEAAELAGLVDPLGAIDDAVNHELVSHAVDFEPRLAGRMTRAAVLTILGARATADAHRRAAEIVTAPDRRLHHRVAAAPLPDAQLADDIEALARQCGTDGAWAQAATLFRDASRLTADSLLRDERLTRAVDALVAAGDCGAAAALVPAVESLRETPLRNAVLAYLAILRGRATEADVRLRRAWDIVNAERDPATAALIAQRYVLHALVRCRGDELVEWADTALRLADRDSPSGIESAAIRGLGLAAAGHPDEATAAYDDLAARLRYGAQAQRVTMGRGWLQLIRDDVDAARSNLESAVATAGLGGSTRITLWALGWLARVQFATGDWDTALATVESGRQLAESSGIVIVTSLLEWTAAQIHALRGDWDAAQTAVRAADVVTQDYEMVRIPTILARAQVAEAEADYARVRRVLEPLARMAPGTSLTEPGYWPWPDMLANALVIDGDLDGADAFLRPHEHRAAERGHRSAMARLGYARGRLLGAMGQLPAARARFEESLQLLDGLPLRYDQARVNFAYGQTLRRAGKRREADAVVSTARELYVSLGAQTLVARCERELKAGGLHQLRGSRDSVELTPQEDAVMALVAQGMSNREVAAELFVSPKTVQYHLTRVYAKLGVRSRAELAALRR